MYTHTYMYIYSYTRIYDTVSCQVLTWLREGVLAFLQTRTYPSSALSGWSRLLFVY